MTDLAQPVAVRLQELAALAGPPDGTTADRALALARGRRRRAARWGAVVLVCCLSATLAGVTRDPGGEQSLRGRQTPAGLAAARAPESYLAPPRGSAADDQELLAALAATDWSGPPGYFDGLPTLAPGTRRVVYAADVPGGHRWAVVVGRAGLQWLYAWFAGPTGAGPDELELVTVDATGRGQAIALMDVSGDTGALVVLAPPGEIAEYSPSLDRGPTGELARLFQPLPLVAGVPTATVTTPITWDAGQVHVLREGRTDDVPLMTTGRPVWLVDYGPDEPDPALLAPCMAAIGIDVMVDGAGGISWGYASIPDLSSAEQAVQERAIDACWVEATGG